MAVVLRDAEDRAVLLIANAADRPIPFTAPPAGGTRGWKRRLDSGAGMLDPDLPLVAAGAAIEVEGRTILVFTAA